MFEANVFPFLVENDLLLTPLPLEHSKEGIYNVLILKLKVYIKNKIFSSLKLYSKILLYYYWFKLLGESSLFIVIDCNKSSFLFTVHLKSIHPSYWKCKLYRYPRSPLINFWVPNNSDLRTSQPNIRLVLAKTPP